MAAVVFGADAVTVVEETEGGALLIVLDAPALANVDVEAEGLVSVIACGSWIDQEAGRQGVDISLVGRKQKSGRLRTCLQLAKDLLSISTPWIPPRQHRVN